MIYWTYVISDVADDLNLFDWQKGGRNRIEALEGTDSLKPRVGVSNLLYFHYYGFL